MNFSNYKQGPAQYPFLEEVASEYLVRPNGKPTLLTHLLKDLGCIIHPESSAHGLTPIGHDEMILSPIVDGIIDDYIRFQEYHPGTYDETAIGKAMRNHVLSFIGPNDFVPESADLKPVSINDIKKFMMDTIIMRVGKSEHFRNNPKIRQLQSRISEISQALATEISHDEVAKITKGREEIMHKIYAQVGEKAGFNGFADQMDALRKTINRSEIKKLDTTSPITNPHTLHLFTTLRALVRACNKEIGIDTQKEQQRLDAERVQAQAETDQPQNFTSWPKEA